MTRMIVGHGECLRFPHRHVQTPFRDIDPYTSLGHLSYPSLFILRDHLPCPNQLFGLSKESHAAISLGTDSLVAVPGDARSTARGSLNQDTRDGLPACPGNDHRRLSAPPAKATTTQRPFMPKPRAEA